MAQWALERTARNLYGQEPQVAIQINLGTALQEVEQLEKELGIAKLVQED
jgi:hypothetical protein